MPSINGSHIRGKLYDKARNAAKKLRQEGIVTSSKSSSSKDSCKQEISSVVEIGKCY